MSKLVRLDNHLHVGKVWGGRGADTPADPEGCAAYLRANEVTHAVVCYSDKPSMIALEKLCPKITFYRLQWVTDVNQKLDKGIHGVKLHSHRGHSQGLHFGEQQENGLDYNSKAVKAFLKNLPEGMIVQYHTQGSTSHSTTSRPYIIGKLAVENRHLKHVIVHSGAFGMRSFYPSTNNTNLLITALAQEALVQEAVLMANRLANVYCDASTLTGPSHYKTDLLLTGTKKVALSSDWPFSDKTPYGPALKMEGLAARFIGDINIEKLHKRAVDWLNMPMEELYKTYGEVADRDAGRSPAFFEVKATLKRGARVSKDT